MAGAQALSSAPQQMKDVFNKFFSTKPRDFVELLIFLRDHDLDFERVIKSIESLKRTCPHNISVDMIKVLCNRETSQNNQYDTVDQKDDQILKQSRIKLQELSLLLA